MPPPRALLDAWHVAESERQHLEGLVGVRVGALRSAARLGALPAQLTLPLPPGVKALRFRASLTSEESGCTATLSARRGQAASSRPLSASLSTSEWTSLALDTPGGDAEPLEIEVQARGCTAWAALSEIRLFSQPLSQAETPRRGNAGRHPDLLLIVLDTLRRDHFDCSEATAELMPHTYSLWCQRGLFLEDAFSTSPWTYPAVASMLTGLRPEEHGGLRRGRQQLDLHRSVTTLAEILRWGGYATGAINPNWQAGRGLWRGFDSFIERHAGDPQRRIAVDEAQLRRGEGVVDDAIDWLDAQARLAPSQPVFLFLLFLDAHEPVNAGPLSGRVPESCAGIEPLPTRWQGIANWPEHRAGMEPANMSCRRDLYREALRYLDEQLGRLARHLEDTGRMASTGLVLLSDHGEEFWDHAQRASPDARGPLGYGHGHTLYGELVRVPLLVVPPGATREPTRSARLASVRDAFATLLGMAGLQAPTSTTSRDLLAGGAGHPLVVSDTTLYGPEGFSVSTPELRAIVSGAGPTRVFDRRADPEEHSPLLPEAPLARRGAALLEQTRAAGKRSSQPSESDRAALRALGYAE